MACESGDPPYGTGDHVKAAFVIPNEPFASQVNMMTTLMNEGCHVVLFYWGHKVPIRERSARFSAENFDLGSDGEMTKLAMFPIWAMWVFVRLCALRADFVQAENLLGNLPALPFHVLTRRKLVYHMTDFTADASPAIASSPALVAELVRRLERSVLRSSSGMLLVSEGQLEAQIPGCRAKPHMVVYNVPVTDTGSLVLRPPTQGVTAFVYSGVLTAQRFEGISLAARLVEGMPQSELIIAGAGQCGTQVEALAKSSKRVKYMGQISHEEVLELAGASTCVLAMYDPKFLNNRIGMPNKLFESMALGKPIIVSKGTKVAEFVESHRCGLSVVYGDETDLKEAMILVANPTVAKTLGENGRAAYDADYSWQSIGRTYLSFLGGLGLTQLGMR